LTHSLHDALPVTGKRRWRDRLPDPGYRLPISTQLAEELADALEAGRELRGRAGVADAQRARLAEGRARHAGYALGFQQRAAQLDVIADLQAGGTVGLAEIGADVGEHVERALRTRAAHPGDGFEHGQHLVALGLELGALRLRHVLRAGQR